MNYSELQKNVTDMIEEQQLKIGYLRETVRLYYPLSSLKNFLDVECDAETMRKYLNEFSLSVRDTLGEISLSDSDGRFCIAVSPDGVEYIYKHTDKEGFLAQLIETVRHHGCTIEQVIKVFEKFSDNVHVEQMQNNEFDYLIYFENNKPDSYRYCVTVEANHIIYHRYTLKDYEEFGF